MSLDKIVVDIITDVKVQAPEDVPESAIREEVAKSFERLAVMVLQR